MKSYYLILLLIWAIPFGTQANNSEKLSELNDQLELLLPGTGLAEQSGRQYAQKQLEGLFSELEDAKVRKKKASKALTLIQQKVEALFLRESQTMAPFRSVFKQQRYDQTSATALYALIFHYFDIPYHLQIQASELVVIPHPSENSEAFKIARVKAPNTEAKERFQVAYLALLRSVGYLNEEENNLADEELFRRYYLTTGTSISLKEAASFLCYRQALLAFNSQAWGQCLDQLGQAQRLSGHPLYHIMTRATWLQLANADEGSRESLYYLWQLWEEKPGHPWQSELLKRFNLAITQIPETSAWRIDSLYTYFYEQFDGRKDAQAQLREMYFLQSARFHADRGEVVQVMNLMDSLYMLQPNDTDVQEVLAGMLVWSLRKERDFTEGLKRIEFYQKHYPFLTDNALFQDQHLFYQAERIHHYFDGDMEVEGVRYLTHFEGLLVRTSATPRYNAWISTAYLAASNYYFRQGVYQQAADYINRALKRAPSDDYLLHRQEVLQRHLR